MNIVSKFVFVLSSTTLLFAGCSGEADNNNAYWPLYGREYNNQHYSPLDAITRNTVKDLRLAWNSPNMEDATRSGDNLYTSSLVGLLFLILMINVISNEVRNLRV